MTPHSSMRRPHRPWRSGILAGIEAPLVVFSLHLAGSRVCLIGCYSCVVGISATMDESMPMLAGNRPPMFPGGSALRVAPAVPDTDLLRPRALRPKGDRTTVRTEGSPKVTMTPDGDCVISIWSWKPTQKAAQTTWLASPVVTCTNSGRVTSSRKRRQQTRSLPSIQGRCLQSPVLAACLRGVARRMSFTTCSAGFLALESLGLIFIPSSL